MAAAREGRAMASVPMTTAVADTQARLPNDRWRAL